MGKAAEKVIATAQDAPQDVSHSLDLGDEFAFIRNDAVFSDASRILAPVHVKVVLVRAKKGKGIAGVLTEPEFLKVCATGINPDKTLVSKHMLTDLLRIRSDTPLEEAVKIIGEKDPDAVLVLNAEKKFVGYLSPADYNEAIELLKKKKIEVFDVPSIKPEIAPPPPPPPDIESPLLDELLFDSDTSLSTIRNNLRKGLGVGEDGPVIWSEDGSEILVHNESVEVEMDDGDILVFVTMNCDQTEESIVSIRFHVGTDGPNNRTAVTEEAPEGHPIIVGRWGPVLQQSIWDILLKTLDNSTPDGQIATGFSAGEDGMVVGSGRPQIKLTAIRSAINPGLSLAGGGRK